MIGRRDLPKLARQRRPHEQDRETAPHACSLASRNATHVDPRTKATDRSADREWPRTHTLTAVRSGEVVVGLLPGAVVTRVKIVVVGEDS